MLVLEMIISLVLFALVQYDIYNRLSLFTTLVAMTLCVLCIFTGF